MSVFVYLFINNVNMLWMVFHLKKKKKKSPKYNKQPLPAIESPSRSLLVAFTLSPKDKVLEEVVGIMNSKG